MWRRILSISFMAGVAAVAVGLLLLSWEAQRRIGQELDRARETLALHQEEHERQLAALNAALNGRSEVHHEYEQTIEALRQTLGQSDLGSLPLPADLRMRLQWLDKDGCQSGGGQDDGANGGH